MICVLFAVLYGCGMVISGKNFYNNHLRIYQDYFKVSSLILLFFHSIVWPVNLGFYLIFTSLEFRLWKIKK
jgi:hypothetical protein